MLEKISDNVLLIILCKSGGLLTTKGRKASSIATRKSLRRNGMGRKTPTEFEWYQRTHADVLTGS